MKEFSETLCDLKMTKLAKEKGFDGLVYEYFSENGDPCDCSFTNINFSKNINVYSRPTLFHLKEWLLTKHNIYVNVDPLFKLSYVWYYTITNLNTRKSDVSTNDTKTYYIEALENGLYKALNDLKCI